ncbi:MAG TPA: MarC family protein [bacterium]|nr:MarC family protein [bacterium]
MDFNLLLENALYFLALINPASKIFLLSSIEPRLTGRELRALSLRATVVAFVILCCLSTLGNYLLHDIFRVEIYSLRVAGGIVLFLIGLTAVTKGRFYERSLQHSADISIVPLGAPLIAGPGTIAASVAFSSEHGVLLAITGFSLALILNLVLMLFSLQIGALIEKLNATGPLIRITGLIVATVAVQMVLTGLGEWISVVRVPM